jgi:methyl-accepting chemotaxis protein
MKSFSAMKVATKLRLGFGGVLALLGIVVGVALVKVQGINAQIVEMADQRYANIALLTDMSETLGLQARNLRNAVIAANDAEELRLALDSVAKTSEENNAAMARLDQVIVSPEARELFRKLADSRAAYGQARDEIVSLVRTGNAGAAGVYLLKTARPAQNDYFGALEVLVKYQTALMQQAGEQAKALGADAVKTTLALALLAGVLALAAGVVITRDLLRQLGAEPADVVGITREVAAGNLAVEIRTRPGDNGSILAGLRDMRDRLADVVGQVRQSSDSIATGSAQIATGNADLSHRTEEQASNLQQTAASMEELTGTVKTSADTARAGQPARWPRPPARP